MGGAISRCIGSYGWCFAAVVKWFEAGKLHLARTDFCWRDAVSVYVPHGNGKTTLAELRRFEHFWTPNYLNLLEPTPEGRHYSGVDGAAAAVIFGGGWAGIASFNLFSNRSSSGSGSV
jgi:hypothetical protein